MEHSKYEKKRAEAFAIMRAEAALSYQSQEDVAWKSSDEGVRLHEEISLTLNRCARRESPTTLAVARAMFGDFLDFFNVDDIPTVSEISERIGLSIETAVQHRQKVADIFTRVRASQITA